MIPLICCKKAVDILDEYLPEMANMRVVLDTGATVGGMAPAIDAALGRRAKNESEGITLCLIFF